MKFQIRILGDSCLRKKSSPVKEIGAAERMLFKAMLQTMYEHDGIGLAAPQIGINQQIFVADIGESPIIVVNPQIIKKKGSALMEEGCLSVPGGTVVVERPQEITVRYVDQHNHPIRKEFSDLMARVFLHETDHLMGTLIVDYADQGKQKEIKQPAQEAQKKINF